MRTVVLLCSILLVILATAADAKHTEIPRCQQLESYIDLVKHHAAHPVDLCEFYLSSARKKSPLRMNPKIFRAVCICLLKESNLPIPKTQTSVSAAHPSHAPKEHTCSTRYEKLIRKSFYSPQLFCQFYDANPRFISPIPGASVNNLLDGCQCFKNQAASRSTSPKSSTNPVTSTTKAAKPGSSMVNTRSESIKHVSTTVIRADTSMSRYADSATTSETTTIPYVSTTTASATTSTSTTTPITSTTTTTTTTITTASTITSTTTLPVSFTTTTSITTSVTTSITTSKLTTPSTASLSSTTTTTSSLSTTTATTSKSTATTNPSTTTLTSISTTTSTTTLAITTTATTTTLCSSMTAIATVSKGTNLVDHSNYNANFTLQYSGYGIGYASGSTQKVAQYQTSLAMASLASMCATVVEGFQKASDNSSMYFELTYALDTGSGSYWNCIMVDESSNTGVVSFDAALPAIGCSFGFKETGLEVWTG
ncbi:hypothetical protein K461DRAFT_296786 [Myriangium duriaei CBS 260.36]|uniref:Uncharacterized protein n=1 Tax=Myriangium duriaei CBS 260.36 TaxID=1168546 RepID=A0A9P4MDL1_9PEZI|nr:hypothetical protein K461DRAFT_296786 [Myriangium duriaei CBS 260.36]